MKTEWRDIPTQQGRYQASNLGAIRSLNRCEQYSRSGVISSITRKHKGRTLCQALGKDGYFRTFLGNGAPRSVARLVCEAFCGKPKRGHQVNHKNGIKSDNRAENLEWVTASGNMLHAQNSGLLYERNRKISVANQGEGHPNNKYKIETVIEIRRRHKLGERPRDLSKEFNIPLSTLEKIIYRETWKHI